MNSRLPIFIFLLCAAIVAAVGDFFSKKWAVGHGGKYLPIAYGFYAIGTGIWFLVIRHGKELGRMTGMWVTGGMLAGMTIGVLVFGERLSPANIVGIFLGILGVILMSL